MSELTKFAAVICALSVSLSCAHADNATVIGPNGSLSEGALALQSGDYDAGIRLTLAGLRYESSRRDRASAFSNLCAGYTALESYAEAIAACDEAVALNERNWKAFNNRALALAGLNRYRDALDDLGTAIELAPASPTLQRTHEWIEARAPQQVLARRQR